jgi:hypothetical protein
MAHFDKAKVGQDGFLMQLGTLSGNPVAAPPGSRRSRYCGARNAAFNKALRGAGVFKSPGKLYPSLAIDDQDLEWTDRAVREAAAEIRLA